MLNIIEVARAFGLAVKRKGTRGEFVAPCPMHEDKHPSLTLNETKSCYHCFSCEAHGNAFMLAAILMGLDYPRDKQAVDDRLRELNLLSAKILKTKALEYTESLESMMNQPEVIMSTYPDLARIFGILPSMILKKLDWFIGRNRPYGRNETNITIKEIHRDYFPVYSHSAVKRAIGLLERKKVLSHLTNNHETAWSIDYDVLGALIRDNLTLHSSSSSVSSYISQTRASDGSK